MRQVHKPKKRRNAEPYRSLHASDLHLSNTLPFAKPGTNGVTDRLRDQEQLIYRIFDTARREKCEAIFLQGDIFDHSRVDAITLTTTVRALAQTPVDLFIIPGNHDGVNTRGERFTVEALSEVTGCHYMETGEPFKPRDWLSFWPLEFAPLEVNREMLARFKLSKNRVNTLLMHNSVVGCTHVGWKCEEGMGFDADEVTARFDHVLSGHFHDPQKFGTNGRFLGAPMHHRFDDMGREAGYWMIDWTEDGDREEQFIDGDAPRFHQLDIDDEDARQHFLTTHFIGDEQVRALDYVKVRVQCTHADLIQRKPKVEELIANMRAEEMRVMWFHDPVYQHTNRIVDEAGDASKVVSPRGMVTGYVEAPEVDTTGLDRKKLKQLGRDIFDAVEGSWRA